MSQLSQQQLIPATQNVIVTCTSNVGVGWSKLLCHSHICTCKRKGIVRLSAKQKAITMFEDEV